VNISNGIIYTIKEQNITDVIIGLHQNASAKEFLGPTAERILKSVAENIYIYKPVQPINTLDRMVVAVTPKAELEPGFAPWFFKLTILAKEAGLQIEFFAHPETITELKDLQANQSATVQMNFRPFANWEDFLIISREIKRNDLLVIISSRKGHASDQPALEKLPYYLTSYFTDNSFLIVYPKQIEYGVNMNDVQHADSRLMETISDKVTNISKTGGLLKRIFGR
jgi:hypothetical protein